MPKILNQQVFIVLLGIFSLILIVTGFSIVGTPISQKDLRMDEQRLSDFSDIRLGIEDYYRQNKTVPGSLSDVKSTATYSSKRTLPSEHKDPESGQPYQYVKSSASSYQLCATFATDSEKAKKQSSNMYYYDYGVVSNKHKKGYDCIAYEIPSYIVQENLYKLPTTTITKTPITKTPTPTVTPTKTTPTLQYQTDI